MLQLRSSAGETVTRENVERLLDAGVLQVLVSSGRYWSVRRNGKTKHWKTRPEEFRIPVKAGFNRFGEITHRDFPFEYDPERID